MAHARSPNSETKSNGNGSKQSVAAPDKSLESWIWDAACSIRGAKDAPKYKEFILPLIFTKRLCDVFDDEINRMAQEVGSRAKAFKLVKHDKTTRNSSVSFFRWNRRIPMMPSGLSSARSQTKLANNLPRTSAPSPMPTHCSKASLTALISTPPLTASVTLTTPG